MDTAVNGDPELASEVVGCLSRELKAARNRVKELESQVELLKLVRLVAITILDHLGYFIVIDGIFFLRNANLQSGYYKKASKMPDARIGNCKRWLTNFEIRRWE